MPQYRREKLAGAIYFFTVNCANRTDPSFLIREIEPLKRAIRTVQRKHDFTIDAIVVLPDHLHCIWTLPEQDHNYSMRWGLIKGSFSRQINISKETISASRKKRGERGIWQRRFWEHRIRDDNDFKQHVDYIHWNPVKHGLVESTSDWKYSSFRRYVNMGVYDMDWGSTETLDFAAGER